MPHTTPKETARQEAIRTARPFMLRQLLGDLVHPRETGSPRAAERRRTAAARKLRRRGFKHDVRSRRTVSAVCPPGTIALAVRSLARAERFARSRRR